MYGMDVLATFRALMRAASPRIDYYATYFGKVVSWDSKSQTVDVTPTDPRLPGMAGVPFRHGLPGTIIDVDPRTSVAITWMNGDPSQPIAFLWGGGEHVKQIILKADQIVLGGADGAEPTIKGNTYRNAEDDFLDAIVTAVKAALSALSIPPATLEAAQTNFKKSESAYLSTNAKVK